MLMTRLRYGLPPGCELPVAIEEGGDSSLRQDDRPHALRAYNESGYVVARKLIPPTLCDSVIAAFRSEVKKFGGLMLRQASARLGRHIFTSGGLMANALLGVHELRERRFKEFRAGAIEVVAGLTTQAMARELLTNIPVLVESMFFESSLVGIPLHADGDYMDSSARGTMLGAWFALEDMLPLSGRFVVVPRSHKLQHETGKAGVAFREFRDNQARTSATIASDIRTNVARRLEEARLLYQVISDCGLQIIAPMLNRGDVLFWNAGLIHGSLPPESSTQSRNSLTAHYVADGHALTVLGRSVVLQTEMHHGMRLRTTRQPDQNRERYVYPAEN
jgi:ectoine hydroxylase-related dioxygenase (phytanoyl-CoA dioxygenase family)